MNEMDNELTRPSPSSQVEDKKCDACQGGDPSQYFCAECESHMCESCERAHRKMVATHKVIKVYCTPVKNTNQVRQGFCPLHTTSDLELICKNCDVLHCKDCIENHRSHVTVPVLEAQDRLQRICLNERANLIELCRVFENKLGIFVEYKDICNQTATDLENIRREVIETIDETVDESLAIVNNTKQGLHVNDIEKEIKIQIDKIETHVTKEEPRENIDQLVSFYMRCLKIKQDVETMKKKLPLYRSIQVHLPRETQLEIFEDHARTLFDTGQRREKIYYAMNYECMFYDTHTKVTTPVPAALCIPGMHLNAMTMDMLVVHAGSDIYKVLLSDMSLFQFTSHIEVSQMIAFRGLFIVIDKHKKLYLLDKDFKMLSQIASDTTDGFDKILLCNTGDDSFLLCSCKTKAPFAMELTMLSQIRSKDFHVGENRIVNLGTPCSNGAMMPDLKHIVLASDDRYYDECCMLYKVNIRLGTFEELDILEYIYGGGVRSLYVDKLNKVLIGDEGGCVHIFSSSPELQYSSRLFVIQDTVWGICVAKEALYICTHNYETGKASLQKYTEYLSAENTQSYEDDDTDNRDTDNYAECEDQDNIDELPITEQDNIASEAESETLGCINPLPLPKRDYNASKAEREVLSDRDELPLPERDHLNATGRGVRDDNYEQIILPGDNYEHIILPGDNYEHIILPGDQVDNTVQSALAMYDYDARDCDEISFNDGDRIDAIEIIDEGWWIGTTSDGQRGMFPSSFVNLQHH